MVQDISLRDIVRTPGKGLGRVVAMLEMPDGSATVTVEWLVGGQTTGPVWVLTVVRPEWVNRAWVDGEKASDD